jgi:hypothetical protein
MDKFKFKYVQESRKSVKYDRKSVMYGHTERHLLNMEQTFKQEETQKFW